MKLVKVAKVGRKVQEVCVLDGANVAEVLRAANISQQQDEIIFKNHMKVSSLTSVSSGDLVIVEKRKFNITPQIERFGQYLMDKIYDGEFNVDCDDYYDDENDSYNVREFIEDNESLIAALISKAKEA
jgi:hypothetical protein